MKQILLTLFMIPLCLGSSSEVDSKPVVVLELFTSQGCSSCPPADKLLDEVLKNNNVIGLSYHVDYWNYIGWKDPFSKESYSNKQRAYGRKFKSSSIYTPQVVINGKEHFVGSNRSVMEKKLKHYLKEKPLNFVKINNTKRKNEVVTFNYDVSGETSNKLLHAVLVVKEKTTHVKRGENRNRTLKNSNIVVAEHTLTLDNASGEGSLIIPELVEESDQLTLVLIIKDNDLAITGATQLKLY